MKACMSEGEDVTVPPPSLLLLTTFTPPPHHLHSSSSTSLLLLTTFAPSSSYSTHCSTGKPYDSHTDSWSHPETSISLSNSKIFLYLEQIEWLTIHVMQYNLQHIIQQPWSTTQWFRRRGLSMYFITVVGMITKNSAKSASWPSRLANFAVITLTSDYIEGITIWHVTNGTKCIILAIKCTS